MPKDYQAVPPLGAFNRTDSLLPIQGVAAHVAQADHADFLLPGHVGLTFAVGTARGAGANPKGLAVVSPAACSLQWFTSQPAAKLRWVERPTHRKPGRMSSG